MATKDKLKYELNVVTGELDLVKVFNENRILTHQCNAAGHDLMIYNPSSGAHIQMDPLVVTDNNGNVVVI